MSLARKAIFGTLWMSGISYIGFALNFGIQLILVRLLVPEDFGLFVLGLSIAEILFIFLSFSFSMAVIQIQEAEDLFDTAFYLSLLSGLVIILIAAVLSLILSFHYPSPSVLVFFLLCALQPINGCASIYAAHMEKELKFKKNAVVRGVAISLSSITAALLAYTGFGVWSLVSREAMAAVLMLTGMRFISPYKFKGRFSKTTARRLLVFSYQRLFSRGLELVYHRVPNFFIGTFAGSRALGLFSQTYYLANLPNVMLAPATCYVAYPIYSKVQRDQDKISEAFRITNYFLLKLLIPILLILFLYPGEVLRILYGEKWLDAAPILGYFAVYAGFLPLFSNANTFTTSLGGLWDVSRTYLIEILLLSIAIFVTLYTGEIRWGALGYSMSLLAGLSIIMISLKRRGMRLNLVGLFFTPVAVSLLIILLWDFFLKRYGIPFSSHRIMALGFLVIMFLVFTILISLFESRRTVENVRFIYKRFTQGNI